MLPFGSDARLKIEMPACDTDDIQEGGTLMAIISKPQICIHPTRTYVGIRTIAAFKGMSKVVDRLRKELKTWIEENGVEAAGPFFRRYHVIDMRGEMDITFGVPVSTALPGDERVTSDVLPAGRYASLIYTGSGLTGNKALIEWVRATDGITFDRWDTEKGDNFRSRYESYLTDPKVEYRKTKWEIEVAIKLADD